jgi:hypothetical protein
MGFEKFHISARNPKVLAYGFTENCQFRAKTDRNSVFLGRDPRIANRLSITVPYFNFYGFWQISHLRSKSMGVSLRFYRKLPIWGVNWLKLCIFGCDRRITNQLSIMVSYFSFYGLWKNSYFCSKSKGLSLRLYRKLPVWGENWSKHRIFGSWHPYCESLTITVPYFDLYGF